MSTIAHWVTDHGDLDGLDRDLLLAEVLDTNRAQILAYPERTLTPNELNQLRCWSNRRRSGEPIAYILGRKEFWSLELTVTPAVLIPRPETELLVEQSLSVTQRGQRILDLGTGSGAIAIALGQELVQTEIYASDISQAALNVAAVNASAHNVAIRLIASDWFANISGTFNTIVSNPPYVPQADPHLANLHTEPRDALISGGDGLDAIRHIVPAAARHIARGGWLLIEHGHDQGAAVRALMTRIGYRNVVSACDLAGIERVSQGQWAGPP
ncbi:MAG: peptide chain release factor N(5)-glutamine methyltransferase [Gammaproteobacteria bacterium]|nr:peptide chain release factor N(5)-glutamine methyltransferase [Gammaproteobacteria bacterium]